MCAASNRLRGDTTAARAAVPAPDDNAPTDVSIRVRADTVPTLSSSVVLGASSDVTAAVEPGVDNVEVTEYDDANAHVPRYIQSIPLAKHPITPSHYSPQKPLTIPHLNTPRFPGDEGQGLVGVGSRGVRMMWSKEIHTAKLHSLQLLESQTQSTEVTNTLPLSNYANVLF